MSANGKQIGDSGGLNWTESSIQTDSEPMCFHKANLQNKKANVEHIRRKNRREVRF